MWENSGVLLSVVISAGLIQIPNSFGYRYRIDTFSKRSMPGKGGTKRGNKEKFNLAKKRFSREITPFLFLFSFFK